MSTFRNPVGPQPSGVYWRRRLVVLLGLVAVVAIVALIVAQPRGPAPAPSGTAAPTAPATPNPTGTSAADAAQCDPAKVTVEALTDSNGYDAGVNPVLSFVLKSTMTVPCAISGRIRRAGVLHHERRRADLVVEPLPDGCGRRRDRAHARCAQAGPESHLGPHAVVHRHLQHRAGGG